MRTIDPEDEEQLEKLLEEVEQHEGRNEEEIQELYGKVVAAMDKINIQHQYIKSYSHRLNLHQEDNESL